MAEQRDPVCGMQVDEKRAAAKSQYQGQTYYFCSQSCKQKFDQAPQQYATGAGRGQSRAGQRQGGVR